MVDVLANLAAFPPASQPEEGITYAAKITKQEAWIDLAAGAAQAERQVRAFNPAPGAFFLLKGERFKILSAGIEARDGPPGVILDEGLLIGCGADSLGLLIVQRAGKVAMSVEQLLRGHATGRDTLCAAG